jgi:2'-5' RNA ligase
VTGAASVGGGERIRIFCALDLPDEARQCLVGWQHAELGDVPGVRPVSPENMHVTLAFLGSIDAEDVPTVARALGAVAAAARPPELGWGRYRETPSVGMVELDDRGGRAAALAGALHEGLEALGLYEPERRRWLPHVTVFRFRERPRLDPAGLGPGTWVPSDAALYHSVLRSAGAQYEILESFALGG